MNIPSRRAGILALALALATALLAVACDNGSGLLQSIQGEAKASKDSIFLKAAVRDLVSYGGKYYAQLVGIYERPAPGTAGSGWTLTKGFGSLGSNYGCRGLVATASGLYAAIFSRDGGKDTPAGIYVYNGTTWTTTPPTISDNIQALYTANNEVFAVTMTVVSDVPHLRPQAIQRDFPERCPPDRDGHQFPRRSGLGQRQQPIPDRRRRKPL